MIHSEKVHSTQTPIVFIHSREKRVLKIIWVKINYVEMISVVRSGTNLVLINQDIYFDKKVCQRYLRKISFHRSERSFLAIAILDISIYTVVISIP